MILLLNGKKNNLFKTIAHSAKRSWCSEHALLGNSKIGNNNNMKNKNTISILVLFAFVFTTSYAISEVYATTPDFHGHKWFWEETNYRYGSMTGFTGLSQSEIYTALDSARTEISSASDYDANKVSTGGDWISKTYWTDTDMYGQQYYDEDWLGYVTDSDIELNYNSNITWYDGTTNTEPNMRVVALHEMGHGVDFEDTETSGTFMFHSYNYGEWTALQTDDDTKMVDIYG